MGDYSYQQAIPSCNLSRATLAEIEKRLRLGIPKLLNKGLQQLLRGLGLNNHQKLENYRITIEEKGQTRTFQQAQELETPFFSTRTQQVKILYKLAAPKVISVEIVFPLYKRPYLKLYTQSPQIEKLLPKIADNLCDSLDRYRNRHKFLHNSTIQALVLLMPACAAMIYGLWSGMAPFPLFASMGWLCLLTLGVVMSLPRLFPWVSFETGKLIQFKRIPVLASFALLLVAIGCYIGLLSYHMPRADIVMFPTAILIGG